MAGDVLEVAGFADDGLEGLEGLAVEEAVGVLGRVVGEELEGEDVGGRLDGQGGVGSVKEVGVVRNRVVEALAAERVHDRQIVALRALRHVPELLEVRDVDRVDVAAVFSGSSCQPRKRKKQKKKRATKGGGRRANGF